MSVGLVDRLGAPTEPLDPGCRVPRKTRIRTPRQVNEHKRVEALPGFQTTSGRFLRRPLTPLTCDL